MADWPGKSSAANGDPWRPAVYHMLDVAAVAEVLVRRNDPSPAQAQALALLVALHDLGKIGSLFRNMLATGTAQRARHWEVSEAYLHYHDGRLAPLSPSMPMARAPISRSGAWRA